MVVIKEVSGKVILDSRKEKTILVTIKTDVGIFSASSPTGKSTGKFETKPYHRGIEGDIKNLKGFSEYLSEEILERFEDLKRVEDIFDRQVGANTLFALESAILKAISKEKKKEIWELINPSAKKFPRLVGNCIGGGKHSEKILERVPDFQEFLIIPDLKSVKSSFETLKKAKEKTRIFLKKIEGNFSEKKNDENAWTTSLNDKEVLEVLKKNELPLGVDVAASSFLKLKKYNYKNPPLKRTSEEQEKYLENLIKNLEIFYIEDPFEEEDFESFANLLKKFPKRLIVGDDLTTTNPARLKKAIKAKSINGIIIKPNQIGSLLEVKNVCELAEENKIKKIFSHRSGETEESILADLAFGFQAEFIKCGITGKEREIKVKRLIEIEKSLK
jgi:enolase